MRAWRLLMAVGLLAPLAACGPPGEASYGNSDTSQPGTFTMRVGGMVGSTGIVSSQSH